MILFRVPARMRGGPHVAVGWKRPADGWRRGPSVILGRLLSTIRSVALRVLYLRAHARRRWLAVCGRFSWPRPNLNAARSAVEAGAGIDSGPIAGVIAVHVVYDARIQVVVGAVVEEVAGIPIAALGSEAHGAKPVVEPAVEADVHAPVAGIDGIAAAVEPPIAGGPERTHIGRLNPRAGHPVITGWAPAPIAGSPDVAGGRRRQVVVVGQRRRSLGCCFCGLFSIG